MQFKSITISLIIGFFLTSCEPDPDLGTPVLEQIGALPEFVIAPADNPQTPEKIELGRLLFWDPILSANKDVACATCHHPNNDYAENLAVSIGVGGQGLSVNRVGNIRVKRNSPTIVNTAFNGIDAFGDYNPINTAMFWDNRANSLENQALDPIQSMQEMRGNQIPRNAILDTIVNRINEIPVYKEQFLTVFGTPNITAELLAKAIASFERSIVANNSRFDQFARGDLNALNALEVRGMQVFIQNQCTNCHNGPMFSDYQLHNLGTENTQDDDGVNGQFRTPSLRTLNNTAPYFHNGSLATLTDAVAFYDNDPEIEPEAQGVEAEDGDVDAIVAFLQSLQDDDFDKTIPQAVPSGLNVGGNID